MTDNNEQEIRTTRIAPCTELQRFDLIRNSTGEYVFITHASSATEALAFMQEFTLTNPNPERFGNSTSPDYKKLLESATRHIDILTARNLELNTDLLKYMDLYVSAKTNS